MLEIATEAITIEETIIQEITTLEIIIQEITIIAMVITMEIITIPIDAVDAEEDKKKKRTNLICMLFLFNTKFIKCHMPDF